MEYAPGGSLSALLKTFYKHGGLPEDMVCRYTRGILLGLRDIHSRGSAHLDVKGGTSSSLPTAAQPSATLGASRFVRAGAAAYRYCHQQQHHHQQQQQCSHSHQKRTL